jgi:hypothetical protein
MAVFRQKFDSPNFHKLRRLRIILFDTHMLVREVQVGLMNRDAFRSRLRGRERYPIGA